MKLQKLFLIISLLSSTTIFHASSLSIKTAAQKVMPFVAITGAAIVAGPAVNNDYYVCKAHGNLEQATKLQRQDMYKFKKLIQKSTLDMYAQSLKLIERIN